MPLLDSTISLTSVSSPSMLSSIGSALPPRPRACPISVGWATLLAALAAGILIGQSIAVYLWALQVTVTSFQQRPITAGCSHDSHLPAAELFAAAASSLPVLRWQDNGTATTRSLPPFVQELPSDWQSTWFRSDMRRPYESIADAQCELLHCNASSAHAVPCALPRVQEGLVTEVHVAYSVCGLAVQELALTSLKTLLLYRHSSVTLHVWLLLSPFSAQRDFISATLQRWPAEQQPHPINPHATATFLHFLDIYELMAQSDLLRRATLHLHLFKQCATTRLWLAHLLPPTVSTVLYVDCDTLFVRDYRQVLAHAQLFSPTQFLSFAYEGTSRQCGSWYFLHRPGYRSPSPFPINSGVMLANLTRWRTPANQAVYNDAILAALATRRHPMGDQDVFNAWLGVQQQEKRDVLFPLPFSYNWRECGMVGPGQEGGVTIMHGNGYKFGDEANEPFWVAMYRMYRLWHRMPSNTTMRVKV